MAFKLSIVDSRTGTNFQVKYENLARAKKPSVVAHAPNGGVVKERTVYQGQVLVPGSTNRQWMDEEGKQNAKRELTFSYEGEEVKEVSQTKVLSIESYNPIKNYTDSYIISKYYELYPSTNDMKKDVDRERARITNLSGMRKLWQFLRDTNQVGRGEMCVSSRGFTFSDAFIRPIEFGNHWSLELGIFAEAKVFEHLQEMEIPVLTPDTTKKRLKMV